MSNLAVNDAGDVVAFDGKEWKPAPVAQNDKGERMAFDGKAWQPLSGQKQSNGWGDAALAVAGDLAKGVGDLAGLPADLQMMGKRAVQWAADKVLPAGKGHGYQVSTVMPTSADISGVIDRAGLDKTLGDNPALTLTDPLGFKGKVNIGKMLDMGVRAVPGSLALGGGVLPGVVGGATSEAAGQATEGTPYELPARILGALPGAYIGARMTTPLPANLTPEQARAVQIAKDTGTPLTVAQETGRLKGFDRALSRYPTSAGPYEAMAAKQGAAADSAALREMGFVGDNVGTETMKAADRQVKQEFSDALNNINRVELKPDFYNRGNAAVAAYTEATPVTEQVKSVSAKMADFFDNKLRPTNGNPYPELNGQQFQEFRKGLSDSVNDLYSSGQSGAAKALQKVRDALDDAAQASLPADVADAMKEARKNYANFKIIEKAAGKGTVASRSEGTLSPSALTMELRKRQGDKFSHTTGGLNDVASMKQYLADTFPNSGTPTILNAQNLMTTGGFGSPAALAGFAAGGPVGAGIGAAAGLLMPNLAARAMTGGNGMIARTARNYLVNQAMPNATQSIGAVPFALTPQLTPLLLNDSRVRQ